MRCKLCDSLMIYTKIKNTIKLSDSYLSCNCEHDPFIKLSSSNHIMWWIISFDNFEIISHFIDNTTRLLRGDQELLKLNDKTDFPNKMELDELIIKFKKMAIYT